MKKRKLILLFFVIAILASFALGFWFGENRKPRPIEGVINQEEGKPEGVDFSLFWDAWRVLQEKYLEPLQPQEMLYGAISGMVKSLGDPYTVFFPPQETKMFKEDISGRF